MSGPEDRRDAAPRQVTPPRPATAPSRPATAPPAPAAPSPRDGHALDGLMADVVAFRLALDADMIVAAAAVDADAVAIAGDVVDAERRSLDELRGRLLDRLALLPADDASAPEAPAAPRPVAPVPAVTAPRPDADPATAAGSVDGPGGGAPGPRRLRLVSVAAGLLGALAVGSGAAAAAAAHRAHPAPATALRLTGAWDAATRDYVALSALTSEHATSAQLASAAARLRVSLSPLLAAASTNPAAARTVLALLTGEQQLLGPAASASPNVQALLTQAAQLIAQVQQGATPQVRAALASLSPVPAHPASPAPTRTLTELPTEHPTSSGQRTASATPSGRATAASATPSPSATRSPTPTPTPSGSASTSGSQPSGGIGVPSPNDL